MEEKAKNSSEPRKKQKVAAMLWYNQGDAAAKVGAEVVNGGGAPKLDDAGKTKQKGTKGKKKWPFGPIYKARDMCQAWKSRDRVMIYKKNLQAGSN